MYTEYLGCVYFGNGFGLRVQMTEKLLEHSYAGCIVKVYEYFQTCIATKTFKCFGFLGQESDDTTNVTACCMKAPNLILLKIDQLCLTVV